MDQRGRQFWWSYQRDLFYELGPTEPSAVRKLLILTVPKSFCISRQAAGLLICLCACPSWCGSDPWLGIVTFDSQVQPRSWNLSFYRKLSCAGLSSRFPWVVLIRRLADSKSRYSLFVLRVENCKTKAGWISCNENQQRRADAILGKVG